MRCRRLGPRTAKPGLFWALLCIAAYYGGCSGTALSPVFTETTPAADGAVGSQVPQAGLTSQQARLVQHLRGTSAEDQIEAERWLSELQRCVGEAGLVRAIGGDAPGRSVGAQGQGQVQGNPRPQQARGGAGFEHRLFRGWQAFVSDDLVSAQYDLSASLQHADPQAGAHCRNIAAELLARVALFRNQMAQVRYFLGRTHSGASHDPRDTFVVPEGKVRGVHALAGERLLLALASLDDVDAPEPGDGERSLNIYTSARAEMRQAAEACAPATEQGFEQVVEADVVVVLGFGLDPLNPDALPPRLQARVERAAELLKSNSRAHAVLTGGGKARLTEAEAMFAALLQAGVQPERLIAEPLARDTVQNAIFSLPDIVRASLFAAAEARRNPTGLPSTRRPRVAVVTDDLHLERAFPLFPALAREMVRELEALGFTAAEKAPLATLEWVPVCALTDKTGSVDVEENLGGTHPGAQSLSLGLARDLARLHGFWLKPGLFR